MINHQAKEIKRLKSELKTLQDGFNETSKFLKGQLANYTLEEVLSAVKEKKKLKKKQLEQIKSATGCPKCGKNNFKETNVPGNRKMKSCLNCDYYEISEVIK